MRYDYKQADPKLWNVIEKENERQNNDIDLIPSENYVSNAVRAVLGSRLTNKYTEGYPPKAVDGGRYYGGCQFYNYLEYLGDKRAEYIFRMPYANLQPLSGTLANLEVYSALLKPGDGILSMSLNAGGHLSHGARLSLSGHLYNVHQYGVNKDGRIDYGQVAELAKKYRPKLIICGASAYPRNIDWGKFRKIANGVHAYLMADIAHLAGMIGANVLTNPADYGADVITMTTHKSFRGPRGGLILSTKPLANAIAHAVFPRFQGGVPQNILIAKTATLGEMMKPSFKKYAEQIVKNAKAMASVFNQDDKISLLTGGTDNHLMILDLRHAGMNGDTLQNKLEKVHITTNKEMIPNDPLPPTKTSGLRVGTPAITTRGFKEQDCEQVARMILAIIHHPDDKETATDVLRQARHLTKTHPILD